MNHNTSFYMEELFSKDIDPRKTKGMQINSVRAQVENRIDEFY